jgi:AhpD family alkylhydroperoxidase
MVERIAVDVSDLTICQYYMYSHTEILRRTANQKR